MALGPVVLSSCSESVVNEQRWNTISLRTWFNMCVQSQVLESTVAETGSESDAGSSSGK